MKGDGKRSDPLYISIHAPRTGSDMEHPNDDNSRRISIHAPRTGSDQQARASLGQLNVFQSTLPARGATGARWRSTMAVVISTHAPRTGSDVENAIYYKGYPDFNPRSPHGERPQASRADRDCHPISTHAPRTGSDPDFCVNKFQVVRFQPTLPARGATCTCRTRLPSPWHFNPRSPHGERHARRNNCHSRQLISTHAPRTGSDPSDARG